MYSNAGPSGVFAFYLPQGQSLWGAWLNEFFAVRYFGPYYQSGTFVFIHIPTELLCMHGILGRDGSQQYPGDSEDVSLGSCLRIVRLSHICKRKF